LKKHAGGGRGPSCSRNQRRRKKGMLLEESRGKAAYRGRENSRKAG